MKRLLLTVIAWCLAAGAAWGQESYCVEDDSNVLKSYTPNAADDSGNMN